jgi:hypothetical protein
LKKTGSPARRFEDYDPLTLQALLYHWDSAIEHMALRGLEDDEAKQVQRQARRKYRQAESTGDPLVDEWEREIAAGRVPDLDK